MKCRYVDNAFERARDAYKDRKYLYLFPHTGETYCAVNYDAVNAELNTFLRLFDVWRADGNHKVSEDGNHQEVWFEVDQEFCQLVKTSRTFRHAIERLGVRVVFEYPFKKPEDQLRSYWRGAADAVRYMREAEELYARAIFGCEYKDED